ncbi:DUF2939 domain-containing protein [Acinetobacter indicus]|uniref:DUF2939 domain-containing protein n=1 Tax=Acinetobacter indicus TaxID=756892 RepID=UPI0039897E1E
MNKKIIGAIIALVVVICGYLYATPYLAINNIKKAAQAGDSEKVSKYIDYPSVRQSFKDQMNAMMMKEMVNQEDDGFAALGAMLASTMVDKMIDGFVTPEGLTMMMQGKDLKDAAQSSEANSTTQTNEEEQAEYKTRYTSFSDFEVVIQDPNDSKAVTVKMVRDGLSWKVNKIVIPMD